jgi:multicomponent Na+:H+ antiporter subunit F
MSIPQLVVVWGGGITLSIACLLALVRVVKGPGVLDRMVASDVVLTTIVLALGTDMVLRKHTTSIPIMIVIASAAAFGTITVARFVRRGVPHDSPDRELASDDYEHDADPDMVGGDGYAD